MRIGLLARRAGVTEAAIRFYERSGLLSPPPRTASGYRDYDESALDTLRFLRAGQSVGLSLAELRQIIDVRQRGEAPCAHAIELLDQHRRRIEDQIVQLQQVHRDLQALCDRARTLDPADCSPDSICQVLAHR